MELGARIRGTDALFSGAEFEILPCNLCARDDFSVLADRDARGLAVRTVLCRVCGLIAINPRPTKAWYERYYAVSGGLRREYKYAGRDPGKVTGDAFEAARRHGRALAERFSTVIRPGLTIDVGSAEGGLLAGFREVIAIEPVGIEPTVERAAFAGARGIKTYPALVENISRVAPELRAAATIICTKSLNHFLDPAYFFRWAHGTLAPDGRILLEVKNFRHQARMSGRIESAIQIDHPFMFVPETISAFVRAAGFELLTLDVDEGNPRDELQNQRASGLPTKHLRIVARKTERPPFAGPPPENRGLAHSLARDLSPTRLRLHYLLHYATIWKNIFRRLRGEMKSKIK